MTTRKRQYQNEGNAEKPTFDPLTIPEDGAATITRIAVQRRDDSRRSIYLDGTFAFGVSDEVYLRFSLFRGHTITRAQAEAVLAEEEVVRCREKAGAILGLRRRSRRELERKLRDKGFSPEAIERTVKLMEEYGHIDDTAYAKSYVHDRLLKRGVGRSRLQQELRLKGVDAKLAAETATMASTDEEELDRAVAQAIRRNRTIRHDDPRKRERSLTSFLAGRGFGWETIRRALERLREVENTTDEPLETDDDRA